MREPSEMDEASPIEDPKGDPQNRTPTAKGLFLSRFFPSSEPDQYSPSVKQNDISARIDVSARGALSDIPFHLRSSYLSFAIFQMALLGTAGSFFSSDNSRSNFVSFLLRPSSISTTALVYLFLLAIKGSSKGEFERYLLWTFLAFNVLSLTFLVMDFHTLGILCPISVILRGIWVCSGFISVRNASQEQ
jgi:hypothetical protein